MSMRVFPARSPTMHRIRGCAPVDTRLQQTPTENCLPSGDLPWDMSIAPSSVAARHCTCAAEASHIAQPVKIGPPR